MFRNTVMGQAMDLVVIVILKAVVSLKIPVYTVLAGQKNTVGDSLELVAVKTVLLEFIFVPSKLRHLNAMQWLFKDVQVLTQKINRDCDLFDSFL